jgi:uncharacterized glyoxalase superfamily protein PhnB
MTATRPTDLFCILRYADADAAMDWLERAFGFEREMVVEGEAGVVDFAAMRFGDDVIGTGTKRPDVHHAIAVYVEDPDAYCERARSAGARITQEPESQAWGPRIYVCEDVEGHVWSFGTEFLGKGVGCDIFPVIGYTDEEAAMAFLQKAFGLEERAVFRTPDGKLAHAELGIGYGIVMPNEVDRSSDNPWRRVDFGLSVHVDDPDAHYARAVAAGAEIVRELRDEEYGARGYSVRDLEGNLWDFSTYRPEGSRP